MSKNDKINTTNLTINIALMQRLKSFSSFSSNSILHSLLQMQLLCGIAHYLNQENNKYIKTNKSSNKFLRPVL